MKLAYLVAAALLLTATSAFGFELKRDSTGEAVSWAHDAQFVVDDALAAALDEPATLLAIQRAASALSASAGVSVTATEGSPAGAIGYDVGNPAANQNQIVGLADWQYDAHAIAVTVVTVDTRTHSIIDADIAFNLKSRKFKALRGQAHPDAAGFDDIQNTITHELGHALGLAHNPGEPSAVMYPAAKRGETSKRTLAADDVAGLVALYGVAEASSSFVATEEEQAAGCSTVAGVPGWLPLLGAAFSLLLRRRKLALALATAVATTASATERRAAPVEEAQQAVKAQVQSRRTLPLPPGARIFTTEVRLKTTDCLKGSCAEEWVLQLPGGRLGPLEQTVEGLGVPEVGEQVAFTVAPGEQTGRPSPSRVRLFRLRLAADTVAFIEGLAKAHRSPSPQR